MNIRNRIKPSRPLGRKSLLWVRVFCALIGLLLLAVPGRAQLTLNYANQTNAVIRFNGTADAFDFLTNPGTGYQWTITSETGGSSAIGLMGSFNTNLFSYGAIVTSGPIETAQVTGPVGSLVINDGVNLLTANVNWVSVTTVFMSVGVLNGALSVNVTNIVYSGSNPDLLYLKNNAPGSMDLSFQFSPGKDLIALSSGTGPYDTSYSGSVSVQPVPEPATAGLLVSGGIVLAIFGRKTLKRK
jgi:hypothetical protein